MTPKVGDYVSFTDNTITEITPRRNDLERPFVSNIDKAFLVFSVKGFDENFNKILKLVACGICFILTIIFLIGSGGIIVPLFIFALLAYMTICGILLLDILPIKTTE